MKTTKNSLWYAIYGERLKVAAKLWSIVRDSDMEKKYSRELLEKNRDRL